MSPHSEERFDAVLELMPWGRNVYTVIRMPQSLATRAAREFTRRLEGNIDEIEVNVGLNRADVIPDAFIYVGKALQRRLQAHAGDVVHCSLAPADPDHVPVPEDVAAALRSADVDAVFASRPAPERRQLLAPVEDAATNATRDRRIAAVVSALLARSSQSEWPPH